MMIGLKKDYEIIFIDDDSSDGSVYLGFVLTAVAFIIPFFIVKIF